MEYIGKVFRNDPWSAVYGIEDGIVWHISRSGKSNCGSVDEFRNSLVRTTGPRYRFHPFTDGVKSELVREQDIIQDWS